MGKGELGRGNDGTMEKREDDKPGDALKNNKETGERVDDKGNPK